MRRAALPLLLAPISAPLGAQVPDTVTIFTSFAHAPDTSVMDRMKAELDAVMVRIGLRFQWRSLELADGHEPMAEIVVVNFRGNCGTHLTRQNVTPGALGWTQVTDQKVLPFSEIDCDRIRDLMASRLAVADGSEQSRLLGRAIARVLAHEIYHFLSKSTTHAMTGIAKARYTCAELSSEHLEFEASQIRAVRRAMARSLTLNLPTGATAGGG
jgi:hypothetical protein